MNNYNNLMKKCFSLAKKARGKNMPNPFVGAIVYDEEKKEIISFGYHEKYGEAHAEVNAIKNANGNTKEKTLIVNLEPCSHFGKTPPCADLIIKSGFKKVVIAMIDPNPKVQNNGIRKLKEAGIEVIVGVLEKEAKELNKIFIKNILYKKPYVMLKTATTLDGKIATKTNKSKWITNETSRLEVQKLRSSYQAIMTGTGTVLADNPQLNVRLKGKKSPSRIIFDPNNKLSVDYKVFNKYLALMKTHGRLISDYVHDFSKETVLFNFGVIGLLLSIIGIIFKIPMNGVVFGSCLSILGFAGFGMHIKNLLPVWVGCFISIYVGMLITGNYDLSISTIIAFIFASGLAPVCGKFGMIFGLVAGVLHIIITPIMINMHGGFDLYNNGFSAGFTAMILCVVAEKILKKEKKKDVSRRKSKDL